MRKYLFNAKEDSNRGIKQKRHDLLQQIVGINLAISVITLNVKELNTSVKRQELADWIFKNPSIYYSIRYTLQIQKYKEVENKRMEKHMPTVTKRELRVAILIAPKIVFKPKKYTKNDIF